MLTLFTDDGNFNYQFLDYILRSFYYTTELSITLINEEGKPIADFPSNKEVYEAIHLNLFEMNECIKKNYSFSIEQNKETILYNHWGILNFIITPLYFEQEYNGSLVAGPMFLSSWNNNDMDFIVDNYGFRLSEKFKILEVFKSIPIKEPPKNFYIGQLLHSQISQELHLGIQHFAPSDSSKLFMKKNLNSTTIEKSGKNNSWIIVNQIVQMVLLSNAQRAIALYKRKLVAPKPINSNNLFYFSNTRYLIINLCMILSHELLKLGIIQQKIVNTKIKFLMEIDRIASVNELFLLGETIIEVFSKLVKEKDYLDKSPIIKKSISYIDENYMKKLTLEEVAQIVNLNPSYFSHTFKNEMKISFSQYLNSVRIKQSQYLLKNTDYSIQDISLDVGYESQHYFSKMFKNSTDLSPSAYRKQFSNTLS